MKPLAVIYWTRVLLGVAAALISTFLNTFTRDINFLNGLSVALLLYIVTYYVYKALFITKTEKTSKIFTTGVFAYFITWIVAWTLFYTILFQTLPPTT